MSRTRIVLLLAALLLPGTADAQLGGLARRAAERAAKKKVEEKATEEVRQSGAARAVYPSTSPEPTLTEPLLARYVAALQGSRTVLDRRDALAGERRSLQERANTIQGERSKEGDAWRRRIDDVESCRSRAIEKSMEGKKAQLLAAAMRPNASPADAKRMVELGVAISDASTKGDTLTAQKLQREMERLQFRMMGIDMDAELAKAKAACPDMPAKPAWMAQAEGMEARADSLAATIRTLEDSAARVLATKAGLSEQQAGAVREKLLNWQYHRKQLVVPGITKAELDLIEGALGKMKDEEIAKLLGEG